MKRKSKKTEHVISSKQIPDLLRGAKQRELQLERILPSIEGRLVEIKARMRGFLGFAFTPIEHEYRGCFKRFSGNWGFKATRQRTRGYDLTSLDIIEITDAATGELLFRAK